MPTKASLAPSGHARLSCKTLCPQQRSVNERSRRNYSTAAPECIAISYMYRILTRSEASVAESEVMSLSFKAETVSQPRYSTLMVPILDPHLAWMSILR